MSDFLSKRIRDGIPTADLMEAIESLVITTDDDCDLLIDAEALMVDKNQVRFWPLTFDGTNWCHWQAGTADSLLGQLASIAMCYRHEELS